MVITFKTFAKLVGVAVGTVAAIAVADKVIDAVYENKTVNETASDSAKNNNSTEIVESKCVVKAVTNAFITLNVVCTLAIKFYAHGLQTGVIYGAVTAVNAGVTVDDVQNTIVDDAAFGHLMNEIGKAVRI